MTLKDILRRIRPAEKTIQTPYGEALVDRRTNRAKRITISVERMTDYLSRRDIADWRAAWQAAINVDNPSRARLLDIYRDVDADLHLSGCVAQRFGFTMSRSFKLVDPSGDEDEQATDLLDRSWFKQLLRYALESTLYGHSLIELGEPIRGIDGTLQYDGVRLIPRKHVVPEYHRALRNVGDDWRSGIDYHDPAFASWLIEAGRPDDLGLYLKAALQTIPKKNMLAFWDAFGENFGMPILAARTGTRDDRERERIFAMMQAVGNNKYLVIDQDTDLQVIETSRTDAYNVYDQRVERANSELSKLVIGQTMTIEDGSSLSQSQTHLEVFRNLVEADCDMIRDLVNDQLLPRMAEHGFPVDGLRFDWDYAVDYTPEQQISYETMIADRYEVDPQYFAEKYSMPVGERRGASALMSRSDPDHGGRGFFD